MNCLPVMPPVGLDDLNKLDIRVGTILSADEVENSDKLVRLTVDFGEVTRTVLVGLKQERESPAEARGRQALFIVNLQPRDMAGMLSEGMLFDIGYSNGIAPALAILQTPVLDGASAGPTRLVVTVPAHATNRIVAARDFRAEQPLPERRRLPTAARVFGDLRGLS
jgi:tRNA-binding protein